MRPSMSFCSSPGAGIAASPIIRAVRASVDPGARGSDAGAPRLRAARRLHPRDSARPTGLRPPVASTVRQGTTTTHREPLRPAGGTRSGSRRRIGAAAARASSRRRCPSAARSAPSPTAPPRRRAPRCTACRALARAVMAMWPGPFFLATPCLMAFSTSGCTSRVGTSTSSASGCTSKLHREAIGEARLLDLEILRQEVELRLERDLLLRPGSRASCAAGRSGGSACDRRRRRRGASARRSRAAC